MKISSSIKGSLQSLAEIADFAPTDSHRKIKARFWAMYSEAPAHALPVTLEYAIRLTGDLRLEKHWEVPGFRQWLLNDKESDEKLAYLYFLSLDALEDILLSTDPKMASARVNAVRLAAELGNRMPTKSSEVKFLDGDVGRMGKAQLKEFVAKNAHLLGLTPGTEIDTVARHEEAVEDEQQSAIEEDKGADSVL